MLETLVLAGIGLTIAVALLIYRQMVAARERERATLVQRSLRQRLYSSGARSRRFPVHRSMKLQPARRKDESSSDGGSDFATSMTVGAVTDNAVLGTALGGDPLGASIGASFASGDSDSGSDGGGD